MVWVKHPGTDPAEAFRLSLVPKFQNPGPMHDDGQCFHFRNRGPRTKKGRGLPSVPQLETGSAYMDGDQKQDFQTLIQQMTYLEGRTPALGEKAPPGQPWSWTQPSVLNYVMPHLSPTKWALQGGSQVNL